MSRMMKFDGRPPLAKSPIRLRPRRSIIRSNSTSLETPLASYARTQGPSRYWDKKDEEKPADLPPEYKSISTELLALAKMVKQDLGNNGVSSDGFAANKATTTTTTSPLFERGRFYDLYSARRNERLKRKIETGSCCYDDYLGVNVETSKKHHRDSKRFESGRKSMSSIYSSSVDRSAHPRYSLRSISSSSDKENQKPPLAARFDKAAAVVECDRKIGARRGRKI